MRDDEVLYKTLKLKGKKKSRRYTKQIQENSDESNYDVNEEGIGFYLLLVMTSEEELRDFEQIA
jgi:hypothetical protein